MSYTFGRSNDNDRKYRVPNYSVSNQTIANPGGTSPTSPGSNTTPNSSTIPGRGTTSPSTAPRTGTKTNPSTGTVRSPGATPTPGAGTSTMPGAGSTQPRPGMGATPTPGAGTSTMPGTGSTQPRPGMITTPTPGAGTSTMPGAGSTQPRPGMITTPPTPGAGTSTMPGTGSAQPRPGMITTPPTPGAGTSTMPGAGSTQPRPGMITTPPTGAGTTNNPNRQPYIYGTAPEPISTPGRTGTTQSPNRAPLNPQNMTAPAPMNNNNQNNQQVPMNGMNAPQQMQGTMPGAPAGLPSTMQPGMNQEMPYFNPTPPYMPGNVPYMSYPPYQGIPNMCVPNANSYNVPMGIPMYPLYGYDNSADLDRDVEYMKRLYPKTAKAIQKEIDNECDKMEYDGSMMFDEYPDKEYIEKLIDRVYDRVKQTDEEPQVEINSLYLYPPRRNQNYLRDIVSLLLLSEIFNRRRRHRGRRRWF